MKKLFKLFLDLFKSKDTLKVKRLAIINAINKIKEAVNNPVADMIVAAIPGRTDDKILEHIRRTLPVILSVFKLSDHPLNAHVAVAVPDMIQTMQPMTKENRGKVYKIVAGKLYETFTGLPEETASEEIQKEYKLTKSEVVS